MASHKVFKPVRHAGVSSQDAIFIAGAAIVEGAPVIFSSGKVIEAADDNAGAGVLASGKILGVALNAAAAANEDVLVALALPGRHFVGSLAANVTASGGSDTGLSALALTDIGSRREMHKDGTTLKFILGASAGAIGTNAAPLVIALVDKVTATTADTRTFGSSGSGTGVSGSATTPPGRTFEQKPPAGPNSGQAQVEFVFPVADTIFG